MLITVTSVEPSEANDSSWTHTDVIIAQDSTRHLAFPDICQLRSKELIVVYREGESHVDPSGRIMLVRGHTKDGQVQFSSPMVVCDTELDDRDPSLVELADGTLLLNFFRLDVKTGQLRLSLIASSDSGHSWGAVQDIVCEGFSEGLACSDAIIELPSGDLVMAVYGKADTGSSGSYLLRSPDGGRSWPAVIPMAVSSAPIFEEPAIASVDERILVALLRTDNRGMGSLYQIVSQDEGLTWSEPTRLNLWGYPADLIQLNDGRLLATYGYRQLPTGIRYCIADQNLSWSIHQEHILRADGHDGGELGYPSSIELESGQMLTVYYFSDRDREGMPYIGGTIYHPFHNLRAR